ncbi:MAG: helix-turn-helix domain-containing protein [Oculatellaceae cyanobacterium Prado106]|nr:helix-turn-helix domain-containing protein [Oculatellaceae cyanobacterium Prado106]
MADKNPLTGLREKVGLTQIELAELIGVSENTIANWEKRDTLTNWVRHLLKLCRVLNCSLEDLAPEPSLPEKTWHPLTADLREPIKNYCQALATSNKRTISKIASFAAVHAPALQYWLNQADKIAQQMTRQPRSRQKLNAEVLVNSLILQNLGMQLSAVPPKQVTLEKFQELIAAVELSPAFLDRYVTFNDQHYLRKLILQTHSLCVYVIGWKPGQNVLMHHHGTSLDAIRVLQGQMAHWILSPQECEAEKIPFEGGATLQKYTARPPELYTSPDLVLIDRRHAHQIENASSQNLVTLHFRFGCPPDDDNWQQPTEEQPAIVLQQAEAYQVMATD